MIALTLLLACVDWARAATSIVALGDSNTEGRIGGVSQPAAAFPARLQELLGPSFTVVNRGVGGDTSRDGLRIFPGVVPALAPATLIVAYGVNDLRLDDAGRPFLTVAEYAGNLLALAEAGHAYGARVMIVAPVPIDTLRFRGPPVPAAYAPLGGLPAHEAEYVAAARNACLLGGAQFVDTAAILAGQQETALGSDGVHLTPAGHVLLAQALADSLAVAWPQQPKTLPGDAFLIRTSPNPVSVRGDRNVVVSFRIPGDAGVGLDVFGVDGRRVRGDLAGGVRPTGTYFATWDLRDDGGRAVAAGLYIMRLRVRPRGGSLQESVAKITVLH